MMIRTSIFLYVIIALFQGFKEKQHIIISYIASVTITLGKVSSCLGTWQVKAIATAKHHIVVGTEGG